MGSCISPAAQHLQPSVKAKNLSQILQNANYPVFSSVEQLELNLVLANPTKLNPNND